MGILRVAISSNLWVCLLYLLCAFIGNPVDGVDPDELRDTVALINSRGFVAEAHDVVTADGYILTLHRIINPYIKSGLKPVLLQHGFLSSSIDFINNSPGEDIFPPLLDIEANAIDNHGHDLNHTLVGNNLGFVLSKHGYDVWLGNSRGNTYSLNHTRFRHNQRRFWKFSFDEMVAYDLPATIDYILTNTKQDTLGYVGHSQGSMIMFALLASSPTYSEKIRPFIALSPMAQINHMSSPLRYLADIPLFQLFLKEMSGPFLPSSKLVKYFNRHFCFSELEVICENVLFSFFGYDARQMNGSRLSVYMSHTPAGTSTLNVVHLMQLIRSAGLFRYDYGKDGNVNHYGQESPPKYKLDMIDNKYVALFYGKNDWLVDSWDLRYLKETLKVPLLEDYAVPDENWSQLDFIWAKDAGKYVNTKILDVLQKADY